jgi:hypothetical protein
VMDRIRTIAPDVFNDAPTRFGASEYKMALFCRLEGEAWARIARRKYNGHQVEIFGGLATSKGNASRQFGVYGPHSDVDYAWAEEAPALHQMAPGDLPPLSKEQAYAIVAAFEEIAERAGWVAEAAADHDGASVIYDIDDETRFDTNRGGSGISYGDLCDEYAAYGELRCSANFMSGRGDSGSRDRCLVGDANRHQCVAVWVPGDEAIHFPREFAPRPDEIGVTIKEALQLTPSVDSQPPRPADGADIPAKAAWLIHSYGYCALSDSVVELYKPADDCELKPLAFQRLYRTSYWEVNPARIDLEGVRMRPDQPFPLYEEAGRRYKNTYLRPSHTGSGVIQPWIDYMAHLLPDPLERAWFCDWLAHKHQNPGIPGVAVIMVAAGPDGPVYGAGRGILRDIIARLLGPKYVKPIDFDVFTGRSAQGIYTDWGAYATLVTVNEAKDTPEAGRWADRRAVYERLREIVDPRAIERTFIKKGSQAFSGLSFASYLVFSNNRDALQIPDGDRRITALANGAQMAPAMAAGLQAWMDQPGNIAELARWLEARDLSAFDAYAPLVTQTKTTMQELSRSALDDAFSMVRRRIGPQRLFTGEQIRTAVAIEVGDAMPAETIRQWVTRQVRAEAARVDELKTPAPEGRHRILAWRGGLDRWVGVTAQDAQKEVRQTGIVLGDLNSVTVPWSVPGSDPSDKN